MEGNWGIIGLSESCFTATSCFLVECGMWIVEIRGRRLKRASSHGVLAQGDCSCVVKREYGDEEKVTIG
jgi:hypothetical protein